MKLSKVGAEFKKAIKYSTGSLSLRSWWNCHAPGIFFLRGVLYQLARPIVALFPCPIEKLARHIGELARRLGGGDKLLAVQPPTNKRKKKNSNNNIHPLIPSATQALNSTLFSAFSLSRCIEFGHRKSLWLKECPNVP